MTEYVFLNFTLNLQIVAVSFRMLFVVDTYFDNIHLLNIFHFYHFGQKLLKSYHFKATADLLLFVSYIIMIM